MMLCKWESLSKEMKVQEVYKYYSILNNKRIDLLFKRVFDIVVSLIMLIVLAPIFLLLAVAIKMDSKGPVFYRQIRVTQYGRRYRIHKFRSMIQEADKGLQVTINNDTRITRVGRFIRKYRLDEICQLIDVLGGAMTFVGTRPEVPKYVEQYTPEMLATLLLPAGVTSRASIFYKNESRFLETAKDADKTYVETILPEKMYYNLKDIENFSFWNDIKIIFMTVFAVLGKEYREDF